MTVAVYGNSYYDHNVITESAREGEANKYTKVISRPGGVANFCRAYRGDLFCSTAAAYDYYGSEIIKELQVNPLFVWRGIEKTPVSCVISHMIDLNRTSFYSPEDMLNYQFNPWDADWHHFMYLDRMDLSLSKFNGTISVDFTDVEEIDKYVGTMPKIDYVIASTPMDLLEYQMHRSENECDNAIKHAIHKYPVRKAIIFHDPTFCYFIGKNDYHKYEIKTDCSLNVLGAGDYFSAFAIDGLKNNRMDLEAICAQTLQMLRKQS